MHVLGTKCTRNGEYRNKNKVVAYWKIKTKENTKIVIQKSGHSCSREVFVMRGSNCNVLIVNVFLLLVGGHCIGVSHSQEVFAAHSGFSVGFSSGESIACA